MANELARTIRVLCAMLALAGSLLILEASAAGASKRVHAGHTARSGLSVTSTIPTITTSPSSLPAVSPEITSAPIVTSLSPSQGPTKGGTAVTLSGSNLLGATKVKFGKAKAAITSDTASSITVSAPAGAVGTVKVKVTTPEGTSAAGQFTYVATPTVAKLSPKTGPAAGGTAVSVTGTNLADASAVTFGSNPGTITSDTATKITVTSPAGAVDKVNVTVTTPGGTSVVSAAAKFTYTATNPVPSVTSISPTSGPSAGGTSVTVNGTNLDEATEVAFGSTLGTITADGASSIIVTSPAEVAGTVDVRVTTSAGTSATISADQFTYANTSSFKPCKTLTASTTVPAGVYLINCTEDVPKKISLVLSPGVVFKFGSGDGINVEGTLDAVGTSTSPITFTSINDNSVGGDTGNGSPQEQDWQGITASTGTVDVQNAVIDYADNALNGGGVGTGALTLTNSSLAKDSSGASGPATSAIVSGDGFSNVANPVDLQVNDPTVQNNSATGVSDFAYDVVGDSLNPNLLTGDSASGSGDLTMAVEGALGASGSWPANGLPLEVDSQLDVPSGVTFTVNAGAIVKLTGGSNWCREFDSLGTICVEGTLDAVGTSTSPITFTSINDNSVGGDTGNGSPQEQDWQGITASTGTVDVQNAVIDYADNALNGGGVGTGALTLTNSSLAKDSSGASGPATSAIVSGDGFSNVANPVDLQVNDPTVQNNSATGVSDFAYDVVGDSLNPNLLTGDSASGSGDLTMAVEGALGASGSWPANGLPLEVDSQLDVPSGVTFTVNAGAIVKLTGGSNWCREFDSLGTICVEGTLDAVGTSTSPITFTSINDNSVGGDTGNGSPQEQDWQGITASTGTVDVQNAVIDYADNALNGGGVGTGALTLTNSSLAKDSSGASGPATSAIVSGDGFSNVANPVDLQVNDPTVQNNSATGVSDFAYDVVGDSLNPNLLTGDSASGSGDLTMAVEGALGASGSWPANGLPLEVDSQLDVPSGVTFTVNAGAIVKLTGGSNWCREFDSLGTICVEGTLDAVGTSTSPITFTSINDNSVGGDTGNGSPQEQDWQGITASTGTVDVQNAVIDYADNALNGGGVGTGALTLTNSSLAKDSSGASGPATSAIVSGDGFSNVANPVDLQVNDPTVQNNSATGVSDFAYDVVGDSLNPNLLTGDSASGSGDLTMAVEGALGASGSWPANGLPLEVDSQLDVPSGVTFTVNAGAIVKLTGGSNWCREFDSLGTICVEGTLDAVGTSTSPITFTSINDNSVGGDTGNGSPQEQDWQGITASTGTVDVQNAVIDYADNALNGGGVGTGALTLTNSSLAKDSSGASGPATSAIVSGDGFSNVANPVDLQVNDPTVQNNSATGVSDFAYDVVGDSLNPNLLTGDSASGSGDLTMAVEGALGASGSWPANGLPLEVDSQLDVPSGVTFTVNAGAIVKLTGGSNWCREFDSLGTICVEGTLDAVGTSTSPITFTSINDNSVGGDTGNGSPQEQDWQGITASTTNSLDLQFAHLRYANTAVDVSAGSSSKDLIDSNVFYLNETAVSISAAVTTNAQIENNAFTKNNVAIDASSNWSTVTVDPASCIYVPTMDATGNTFDGSNTPLVSQSDYETITTGNLASLFGVAFVEDYPDGWTDDVQPSNQDTITVNYEPCIDVLEPEDSYVAIAVPLNLDGSIVGPLHSRGAFESKKGRTR